MCSLRFGTACEHCYTPGLGSLWAGRSESLCIKFRNGPPARWAGGPLSARSRIYPGPVAHLVLNLNGGDHLRPLLGTSPERLPDSIWARIGRQMEANWTSFGRTIKDVQCRLGRGMRPALWPSSRTSSPELTRRCPHDDQPPKFTAAPGRKATSTSSTMTRNGASLSTTTGCCSSSSYWKGRRPV